MTHLTHIQANLIDLVSNGPSTFRDSLGAEVKALSEALAQAERVRYELNAVEGAMELVLQLLDAAHARPLMGEHLHCLLSPLQAKLSKSLTGLDEVL
ncbi:DUF1484 family protein [Pseudomonas japonica]|uniref:DUF1484 family protein n=1 Tax=Pseudomonas japonica TaxID=256466 RepID=UPI0015E4741E|nr:DUF1484 family protein [Pseudomonas japonica]MBA1289195.1 DUF1484 family protein [Pseudomonas japonica]